MLVYNKQVRRNCLMRLAHEVRLFLRIYLKHKHRSNYFLIHNPDLLKGKPCFKKVGRAITNNYMGSNTEKKT